MQSTTLSSPLLPPRPFSGESPHRRLGIQQQKRPATWIFAAKRDPYDRNYGGRAVDENMIVLRKRIHEMKMVERNYEPPSNWMGWEKRYYTCYDADICEAMGFLQSQLMNTRPSLALGMVALISLSVLTSVAMVMFHLMEIAKGILAVIN
ncbi:hypothetical protein HHK36_014899 [Tetracentron sinense]|uniref:Uncharacterized protein n=1 Tax=Tetracentron sinense TaxID=13715 RepID=A0A835DCB1_TETSI|nr:hypothetical protein HHK36_014899 [Tetracentron sinense]